VSGDRRSLPAAADGQPVILSSPASPWRRALPCRPATASCCWYGPRW